MNNVIFDDARMVGFNSGTMTEFREAVNPQPPHEIYAPRFPQLKKDSEIWEFATESQSSTWNGMVVTGRLPKYKINSVVAVMNSHKLTHGLEVNAWGYIEVAKIKITGIRAEQIQDKLITNMMTLKKIKVKDVGDKHQEGIHQIIAKGWNARNPDHPYHPKLWTFVYEFEIINEHSN